MKSIFFKLLAASALICSNVHAQTPDSTHIAYYLDSASVYKEVMDYDKSLSILSRIPPAQAVDSVKKMTGRILYLKGDSASALKSYNSVQEKDWADYVYLGLIHEDLKSTDLAIKAYERSLSLQTNSIALLRLGKLYFLANDISTARRFFSQLINFEPSVRIATVYLGECSLKAGDFKDAYKYYARGLNYYPDNRTIKTQLLAVKKELGEKILSQLQEAVDETRKAVKFAFYTREENIPVIRVGIATRLKEISFRAPADFTICDPKSRFTGKANALYTITLKQDTLVLSDRNKSTLLTFKDPVELKGDGHPFYLYDITYGKGYYWHKKIDRTYRGDFKILVDKATFKLINEVSMEEYLYGVLAAEISPSSGIEALRAQAIAARSIVFASIKKRHNDEGFDVCADVHCQVYQGLSVETPQTIQAVKDTRGQVLFYDGHVIEAFYHSNCGGCLKSDIFGGKVPYLETHIDAPLDSATYQQYFPSSTYKEEEWFIKFPQTFCSTGSNSNYRWQRIYDAQDFLTNFGFPLNELKKIVPLEKDDCYHYNAVKIVTHKGNRFIRGDSNIRHFFDNLRSSAFRIEIKYSSSGEPEMLIIWGAGFGHGGGMCQEGAITMAGSGFTYREILKHYYPKARIRSLY